jgi:PPE-repeat protein
MTGLAYLVGGLPLSSRRAASTSAHTTKAPQPDRAEAPAAAATTPEKTRARRRRRATAQQLGRGYEYMDLEPEPDAAASDRGAGPLGFTGTTSRAAAAPTGLTTRAGDAFGAGSAAPMMPSTWDEGSE